MNQEITQTQVLFGPYGTRLDEISLERDLPGLSNPANILNGPRYRNAISELAEGYLRAGALVAAINTFRVRLLLHSNDNRELYGRILAAHMRALRDAIAAVGLENVFRVVSLGPAAEQCYHPEKAPKRREAFDFHSPQAYEAGRLEANLAWFETVSTIEEAIGIAAAAKSYRVPCLISFVIDRDGNLLSGENPRDAIYAVDDASGNYPYGYGFNCCPIEGIPKALAKCGNLASRVKALYPNASSKPQLELEGLGETKGVIGVADPEGVAKYLNHLARCHKIEIIGGCCGFKEKDIAQIVGAVRNKLFQENLPLTDRPK